MELNQIKLYGKVIDLEVGDLFWSNNRGPIKSVFYSPKGKNTDKIPRGGDTWHRRSYVSCQKYINQILAADNLQKRQPGKVHPVEWVVKYVYKQDRPEYEGLIVMSIRDNQFKAEEVQVERETDKLLFIKPYHPILYVTKFEKSKLLQIAHQYDTAHGACRPDDYHKLEEALLRGHHTFLKEKIRWAEHSLNDQRQELKEFEKLVTRYGYSFRLQKRTK